jgi:hypothetical protein
MAKSQREEPTIVFQHTTSLELRRLKLHRAPSLAYLDIAKLDRATAAEFELGHVEAGGCRTSIHAVVLKGKVVGFRVTNCTGTPVKMSPEFRDLLGVVREKIRPGGRPWQPMPVSVFLKEQGPDRSEPWMVCSIFFGGCIICSGTDDGGCILITGDLTAAS